MLRLIVNLFNFIGGVLRTLFIFSYSIGKVMFTFCTQAVRLLFTLLSTISSNLWILCEEFHIFWSDVTGGLNKLSLSVSDGAVETVESFRRWIETVKEKTVLYATRQLGLADFGLDLMHAIKYLFQTLFGGLALLSDIIWFLIMILPNVVLFVATAMLACLETVLQLISLCTVTIRSMIFEMYDLTMHRIRSQPFRFFFEFITIVVLLTNSLMLVRFAQVGLRFARLKTTRLIRQIYSRCVRMRSRRQRQSPAAPRPGGRVLTRRPLRGQEPLVAARRAPKPVKPTSTSDNEKSEAMLCIICQERQRCIVLFPCKHLCLCDDCSRNLMDYQSTCPLCRIHINNQLKVYA